MRGSSREQVRGDGGAAEVFHLVLLGKKNFPLQEIDGHIHFRKRKIGTAFFRKRRSRMHEHIGDSVGVDGTKTSAQQRNAVAIETFNRLHFFSGHFGGKNRTGGQNHLSERLGPHF